MATPSAQPAMTGAEWINRFALALGVDAPSDDTITCLLALAGTAAHASERIAAPIACFLVAQAGIDVEAAQGIAATIASPPAG